MAVFGIVTDTDEVAIKFVSDTKKRLENNNLIKNPFIAKIKTVEYDKELLHIVSMRPIFFNFSIFGWLTGFTLWFLWGLNWYVWPCLFIGALGIFWRKEFYAWVFKKGLKKAGYKGAVKQLPLEEVIDAAIFKDL